jgi:hypothetical protein
MDVENEAALLYAQSVSSADWESVERNCNDADKLQQEYRGELFSERAVALLNEETSLVEA